MKTNTLLQTLALLFLIGTITVPASAAWPEQVFAPYVDTGLWPDFSITGMTQHGFRQGVHKSTFTFTGACTFISLQKVTGLWPSCYPARSLIMKSLFSQ